MKNNVGLFADTLRAAPFAFLASEFSRLTALKVSLFLEEGSELDDHYLSDLGDDVEVVSMKTSRFRDVESIDLAICPDFLSPFVPRSSAIVSLWHSLVETHPSHYRHSAYLSGNPLSYGCADYLIFPRHDFTVQTEQAYLKHHQPLLFPEMVRERKEKLTVAEAGFPKIDLLRGHFKSQRLPRDSVVYAPTNVLLGYCRAPIEGVKILKTLREHFKGQPVIFRPYPTKENYESLREAIRYCEDASGMEVGLDHNPTQNPAYRCEMS